MSHVIQLSTSACVYSGDCCNRNTSRLSHRFSGTLCSCCIRGLGLHGLESALWQYSKVIMCVLTWRVHAADLPASVSV